MHVVYVNYWYDRDIGSPEELLSRYASVRAFAEAIADAGAQVSVVQRFNKDSCAREGAVSYHFVADRCPPGVRWHLPSRFHEAIRTIAGTAECVVHVNGLIFPLQVRALRARLPKDVPIVVQHHAERPWTGLKRQVQRRGLAGVDGFLFTSGYLADAWRAAEVITPAQPVHEVMESPVAMHICNRNGHRRLAGAPVVLWVGRLNAGKDPLTVLTAFEEALQHFPSARMYMVYSEGELVGQVRRRIAHSASLHSTVTLVGRLSQSELAEYYANSDIFVLGSHHEGSGYALAEAMAHGVVPVVTDIPSFAAMTNGAGFLWKAGDTADCAKALLRATRSPITETRTDVLNAYAVNLSPQAIGEHALAAYRETLARRAGTL